MAAIPKMVNTFWPHRVLFHIHFIGALRPNKRKKNHCKKRFLNQMIRWLDVDHGFYWNMQTSNLHKGSNGSLKWINRNIYLRRISHQKSKQRRICFITSKFSTSYRACFSICRTLWYGYSHNATIPVRSFIKDAVTNFLAWFTCLLKDQSPTVHS